MMRRASVWIVVYSLATVCFAAEPAKVAEAWASDGSAYANTDSLAAVMMADGSVRLYATSKDGHRLEMIDASTGKLTGTWGTPGTAAGELKYPNGIATLVFGDHGGPKPPRAAIAVVERDNKRVQVIWPDSGKPAGSFGAEHLNRPYGVAFATLDGKPTLCITDTEVSPERTVHVFELEADGDDVKARHVRSFGEASGPGVIGEAESIAIDTREGRVLLCDETARNVKVYSLDGKFSGKTLGDGLVEGDPEGLAVVEAKDARYVILTDQRKKLTVWHVFDAGDYRQVGSWTGTPTIANTDGIALFPHKFDKFPHGAFFAVDDDREIRAYRLEDVLKTLDATPRE